ncbi:hypothetical protein [Sphingobacterium cellulitidis]|uniref:hypothetical protein n=1 Tax=Sphingobacterium cellulitidis TaxID=1768011 RepID=UPI0015C5C07D|nr:hypothetical protein [Sphingobacterium cellulitidis]
MSPLQGCMLLNVHCYRYIAPMGLYVGECSLLQICRPDGAVRWGMFVATDMPPLWGLRIHRGRYVGKMKRIVRAYCIRPPMTDDGMVIYRGNRGVIEKKCMGGE